MAEVKIIKPHQGFQEKFVRTNVDVCISGGVLNCGKAQPLHSNVLTPNGYVRIGDLKKDDVICDTQGGLQIIEEVFDRGVRDNYRVEFNNGAVVECCDEHLWTVYDSKAKKEVTVELSVVMKDIKRYKISLPKPIYFNNDKELPLSPYFLGIMIGDGTYTDDNGVLRINTDVECINRATLFEEFEYRIHNSKDRMPTISIHNNRIRQIFRDLNFWGQHSYTKKIPQEYLYSSVENRKELLRGLFDTDGFNDKVCSRIEYCTTSEQLCKDVVFLIRSLGGYAKVSTKIGSYKKDGVKKTCKKVYRIYCIFNNPDEYFTLGRKKTGNIKKKRLGLKFSSITNIGKEYMRCIKVSNPNSLYITDDFVVTHNTCGAVLMCAEPSLDPNFRGVFLRNNLGDLRSGGGILDEFKSIYRGGVNVVESGEPRAEFPSGARIDVTHVSDQSREKVRQRFKGRQYDLIYFDEMTGFTWECFTEVCTRNRGTAKWTGKIRGTTNPDRNHWLRKFLDWYIGIDGFIREDREGVVRYFYMSGETVNDVVWGDSKDEVYKKCKIQIDRQLAKINGSKGKATYEDIIRSFTFYLGRMSENVSSIGNNKGYIGAVAMSGGRNAEQVLEGNWNVSPDEDLNAAIPPEKAREVFTNDEARNGDRWVTCDLADTGTDNFLALAWDGFHVYDCLILNKTTPRQNAERLQIFAEEHDVADDHIIYDAIRGTYINDYIEDAIQFVSYRHPMGMYGRMARNLKDECYLRLVEAIKRNQFSIDEKVAERMYEHSLLKERSTIQNEFLEECAVVMFKDSGAGKKTLLSKKEMNRNLGKGRSMDLLDPCAMRMLPVLDLPYGDELLSTMALGVDDDNDDSDSDIYDDSFWC